MADKRAPQHALPDHVLPCQWQGTGTSPELRLFAAVLASAADALQRDERSERDLIYAWMRGAPSPLPFALIAEHLGFEPSALRRMLKALGPGMPRHRHGSGGRWKVTTPREVAP